MTRRDGGFDLAVEGGTIRVSPGPSVGAGTSIVLSYIAEEPPVDVLPPDAEDGSDAAPPGEPQEPDLLAGYAAVPGWRVAGVHYRVGPHAPPTRRPQSEPGIEVSGKVVNVNGDGAILAGCDLTGYNVVVRGHGCSILNCLLRVGNSPSWYLVQVYGDGCTIDYNEFDGRGETTDQSALVAVYGSDLTFTYNDCHDFAQHVVEMVQAEGVTTALDYRFNLIRRGGTGAGAHLNTLQWNSGRAVAVVAHNTVYQEKQQAAGEAFQFYGNSAGWSCNDAEVSNNVMISAGGDLAGDNPAISYFLNLTAGTGAAFANYFDLRSAYGWLYPGTAWHLEGNIDMVDGSSL